jgi:hypothetical protein
MSRCFLFLEKHVNITVFFQNTCKAYCGSHNIFRKYRRTEHDLVWRNTKRVQIWPVFGVFSYFMRLSLPQNLWLRRLTSANTWNMASSLLGVLAVRSFSSSRFERKSQQNVLRTSLFRPVTCFNSWGLRIINFKRFCRILCSVLCGVFSCLASCRVDLHRP